MQLKQSMLGIKSEMTRLTQQQHLYSKNLKKQNSTDKIFLNNSSTNRSRNNSLNSSDIQIHNRPSPTISDQQECWQSNNSLGYSTKHGRDSKYCQTIDDDSLDSTNKKKDYGPNTSLQNQQNQQPKLKDITDSTSSRNTSHIDITATQSNSRIRVGELV